MAKKKTAPRKAVKQGAKKTEDSLAQLSQLSREELLIKLGQLMSENAALRQKASLAAKTTQVFRDAAQKYLGHRFEGRMKDYED